MSERKLDVPTPPDAVLKIMLIDDCPEDLVLCRTGLRQIETSYELEEAQNGMEARRRLEEGYLPNLIMLDLDMPVMDGVTFLEWIKSDQRFRAIPVVVYSTSGDSRDVQESWERQCAAYVVKPTRINEIEELFRKLTKFYFRVAQLPVTALGS